MHLIKPLMQMVKSSKYGCKWTMRDLAFFPDHDLVPGVNHLQLGAKDVHKSVHGRLRLVHHVVIGTPLVIVHGAMPGPRLG